MNKIITIIAALTCVFTSYAQEEKHYDFEFEGIKYKILSEEQHSVETVVYEKLPNDHFIPYGNLPDTVILPSNILHNGTEYSLVKIGHSTFAESNIVKITLPTTVRAIDGQAFRQSTLTTIEGLDSVRDLGFCAFGGTRIKEFTIPDSIKSVGIHLFMLCHKLRRIEIPACVKVLYDHMFLSNNPIEIKCNIIEPLKSVSNYSCFYGMGAVNRPKNTWLVVPRQSIEKYRALRGWEIFKDKTLPDDYALDTPLLFECDGLFFSKIPDSDNLVAIVRPPKQFMEHPYGYGIGGKFTVPSKVSFQGEEYTVHTIGGFMDSEYEEIVLPPTVKVIDRLAFIHSKVKRINLDHITEIRHQAFQGSDIETVKFPNGITLSIDATFYDCKNLRKVDLSSSIVTERGGNIDALRSMLFCNCENLDTLISRGLAPFGGEGFGYDNIFGIENQYGIYKYINPTVWVPQKGIDTYREKWGKYFDDFRELEEMPVAIDQVNSDKAYAISIEKGRVNITDVEGATVTITSVSGQNHYTTTNAPAEIAIPLPRGVYLLTINGSVTKFCI